MHNIMQGVYLYAQRGYINTAPLREVIMKKLIAILIFSLTLCGNAQAATAFFTGQMNMGQSVTGRMVYNCQYQYAGHLFWRSFATYCPQSIEIY
jgi:hypothetical protein